MGMEWNAKIVRRLSCCGLITWPRLRRCTMNAGLVVPPGRETQSADRPRHPPCAERERQTLSEGALMSLLTALI
jgi:hypothetical protein